jgi:phage shock protein C
MSTQPPSRTKFYLDKRNGKIMGVCAGIADYTGLDPTLVRLGWALMLGILGPITLFAYFVTGWAAPEKPVEFYEAESDPNQRKFWQGVRSNPSRSARDIHSRFRDIDRRLADIEHYVTTENRSLAREIEQLR